MGSIRQAIIEALLIDRPMTVRQVFYRLVCNGVIGKSEAEYKTTVVRLLGEMRKDREIPYGWIADNTRMTRKPKTFSDLDAALRHTAETYRRSVWNDQDVYVEIWLEKDALSGVLFDVTSVWDVPLMVTRGYPSLSFLDSAGEAIQAVHKPAFLYYLGDHDPSGCDITRNVEEGIRSMAPKADITFERVAVTRDQIEDLKLPTRPTKKTDSRSKGFIGESVEVDAIPPRQLRELAEQCIVRHIDREAYEAMNRVEAAERETMQSMSDWFKHDTTTPEERARQAEERRRDRIDNWVDQAQWEWRERKAKLEAGEIVLPELSDWSD